MRYTRFMAAALLCALTLYVCASARANGAKEQAQVAFRQGLAHFEAGRYQEAVEKFRETNEIMPSWKLLYNIGQCEAVLKNYGRALEAFEAYLVYGGDDVPQDRQTEVRKEIARLRDLSGEIQVAAPAGSRVFVDGVERGRTPIVGGILVGAGMREAKIVLDGSVLLEQQVRIRGRSTVRVEVPEQPGGQAAMVPVTEVEESESAEEPAEPEPELEPEIEPEPSPPPEDEPVEPVDEPLSKKLVAGGILTGLGGAVMIAGFITGGVSLAKTKDLEDRCPDKHCPDPGDRDLHDETVNLSRAADVLVPVGATLAAVGVVLIILDSKSESAEQTAFRVLPMAGPEHFGVGLERRF